MSQFKETTEVNEKGWKVTKIRNDKGDLIKKISEKACGCKNTTGYTFDDYCGYDDVDFCEFHQFLFDKEIQECEEDQESNWFPDDIEFFYKEEAYPFLESKIQAFQAKLQKQQDKATQTD